MARLTVRLPDSTLERLDSLCAERGVVRAVLVRRLITAALEGPIPEVDTPSQEELLALLSEKARQGNVAAIRSLLAREDELEPRERAMLALKALAEERQP